MKKIFGNFKENILSENNECLQLSFSPSSIPIQERWKRNGLSADFAADYDANEYLRVCLCVGWITAVV